MAAAQLFNTLGRIGVGVALAGGVINSALYNVEGVTGPSSSTGLPG